MMMKSFFLSVLTVSLALSSVASATIDPWDSGSCTGSAMSWDEAVARFKPGMTSAGLGEYEISERHRVCNKVSGCTDWTYSKSTEIKPSPSGFAELYVRDEEIRMKLVGHQDSNPFFTRCDFVGTTKFVCNESYLGKEELHLGDTHLKFAGLLTNRCVRLSGRGTSWIDSTAMLWKEIQWVLLGFH